MSFALSAIVEVLDGVLTALILPHDTTSNIADAIKAKLPSKTLSTALDVRSLREWHSWIETSVENNTHLHYAKLAISIAALRQAGHARYLLSSQDLEYIWSLILQALREQLGSVSTLDSPGGVAAVPLCSIIQNGNIQEQFQLHAWVANGSQEDQKVDVHCYQSLVRSWALAGQSENYTFREHDVDEGVNSEIESFLDFNSSTGQSVRLVEAGREIQKRGTTYEVPPNVFHRTEVAAGTFHAKILHFDAMHQAPKGIPLPKIGSHQLFLPKSDVSTHTALMLAELVESVRRWEELFEEGMQHTMKDDSEEAVRAFQKALHICRLNPELFRIQHYRHLVMVRLGFLYRTLGRHEVAKGILEDLRHQTQLSHLRAHAMGELAVVYRHMSLLDEAIEACTEQYEIAQQLGSEREVCRAVGTLGMLNYQLALEKDPDLMDTAILQLKDRVERARKLKTVATGLSQNVDAKSDQIEWASQREAIGLGRLSLCYRHKGNTEQAISTALEGVSVLMTTRDTGMLSFARGLYGLAMLDASRTAEALAEFNRPNTCTPIIFLCREPSEEHRGYITEMINAGADLELRDELGYSALDCTVYNSDNETQTLIEEGLRQRFRLELHDKTEVEKRLHRYRYEAMLRRGYRDIFQERLRPVLLQSGLKAGMTELRRVYAETLASEAELARMFDHLTYVRFVDFLSCGRIPKSDDGLTHHVSLDSQDKDREVFIIFLSYRWAPISHKSNAEIVSPDDAQNSRYHQMLSAIEDFRRLHSEIDIENLGIWIDYACIDQADYDHQKPGIAALLMNLTQCNAMISLVDSDYYERSWCFVEVSMIEALRDAYNGHLWYEHIRDPVTKIGSLRKGVVGSTSGIGFGRTKVTYESDRPLLMFLQRQTKLIG